MTHQYRQRIAVTVDASGAPAAFFWRRMTYHVAEVLARWHLRDRWWKAAAASATGSDEARREAGREVAASDRHYYRVCCVEGLLCELYFDAASDAWTLDRVLD